MTDRGPTNAELRVVERRLMLQKRGPPPCAGCGEREQIQLRRWMQPIVEWKCRMCGARWVELVEGEQY